MKDEYHLKDQGSSTLILIVLLIGAVRKIRIACTVVLLVNKLVHRKGKHMK